jgi:hypothetical protein
MKRSLIILLFIILLLSSCVSKSDYKLLQEENQTLREEIEELKTSAPKLLAILKISFEENNYNKCKEIFEDIMKKHPESDEFKEAKLIIDQIIFEEKAEKERLQRKLVEIETERLKALNKLKKKFDDVSGIIWYKNSYFVHYTNSNHVSVYMGKTEDTSPWIRLTASYCNSDWIFFEKVYLSYDGNTKEVIFDRYDNKETDHSGGSIWEWIDIKADNDMIKFLWLLSNGETAKVRFVGKYSKTRILSWNEKQAIKDILNGYMLLTKENLTEKSN